MIQRPSRREILRYGGAALASRLAAQMVPFPGPAFALFPGVTLFVDTASSGGDGTTPALSGAHAAYASLNAALAYLCTVGTVKTPLTTPYRILCAASGGTADTTACLQAVWSFYNSPTNYVLITPNVGQRHNGKWSATKYRLEITDTAGNGNAIYNNYASAVRLDGLQIKIHLVSAGANGACYRLATANNSGVVDHRISNCIAWIVKEAGAGNGYGSSQSAPPSGGTVKIWNFVGYGNAYQISAAAGGAWMENLYCYNCTASGGLLNYGDGGVCINCISVSPVLLGFSSVSASSDYNSADDATATGAHSRNNQTFSFVNAAGGDFHLQAGDTGARGYGLADPASGLFADDIDGQIRGATWDIGADQYVA